jgi:hypothetical protein
MTSEMRSTGFVLRLYRNLARCFPHRFRCAFEREMLATTDEAAVWIRRQNLSGVVFLFADLALTGLVTQSRDSRKVTRVI